MARPKPKVKRVRTTVSLPRPIYEEARAFVGEKSNSTQTISSFFATAIVAYLKLLKRKRIDAQFAAMSEDADYQRQAKLISEEFSQSDWEAFESIQREV